MEKAIFNQEASRLKEVRKVLQITIDESVQKLELQQDKLVEERRRMWEECAHGVSDYDDIIVMNQYDETVREEQGHYVRRDEERRQLQYLMEKGYFGRIDFIESGEFVEEKIYIGRYGFRNKKNHEYLIYDWRTPIASMFYDCMTGNAQYDCPNGKIGGKLTLKRQYKIEDGELQYYYDTNIAVQDELLGEVLSENTDKVLRVIIDTITKEQNVAIRQAESKDLLVIGPAGSGKTSVVMHRLAYLLYQNRSTLSSEKIVVLSKSQIFASYVSGILPELGEENVNDVMFDDLVIRGIPKEYKKHGYYEQVEYLLKTPEQTVRKESIQLKYSPQFLAFLKEKTLEYTDWKTNVTSVIEIYLTLLKQYVFSTDDSVDKNIFYYTNTNIKRQKLYYEDILIISYIRILLGAIPTMPEIHHVVIDEAQDYNYLQLEIIKSIYTKSRFTILADANQVIDPLVSTVNMQVFADIFGAGIERIQLSKSYRSTAPINRYAFDILGIHDNSLYVDREGKEPEIVIGKNMKQQILELIETIQKEKAIGILTCDKISAQRVGRLLKSEFQDERRLQCITKEDIVLQEKIVVMPIMLAKGLEFDVVIVWDDRDESYWMEHKNLRYLMCTRALHELFFVKSLDSHVTS